MPPIYFPGAQSLIPGNAAKLIDDDHFSDATLYNHWVFNTSGGGSINPLNSNSNNNWELLQLLGAASPSFVSITRGIGQWAVPNGFWQVNFHVVIPFTLSNPAQTYILRVGLGDQALADFSNGIYFEYTDSAFLGAWGCCLASGGVRTKQSGIAAVTAGTVNSLKVYGFGPGTAIFNINGNIVAGISTNFPAQTVPLGLILQVQKTNGAGAPLINTDYAGLFYVPTR
jgi:hypothetical protein